MRRIAILAATFLLAACAWAQPNNPQVRDSATDPTGVACTAAAPILRYTTGNVYFGCGPGNVYATLSGGGGTVSSGLAGGVAGYAANGTTVGPIAQWMRQPAPVITPYAADTSPQVQEPSVILDTSPEILTGLNQVVKMTWTDGWWYTGGGGAGIGICFGESPDGITPPTRSSTCPLTPTIGFARSWLMKDPVNAGHYILYATENATGHIAQFTGSTVAGLTLAHSNILTCGSNGNEGTATTTGNTAVWYDTGQTHHWRMLYDCTNSTSSPTAYADWLAYSDDGFTWTKAQTAPVIGYGSGVTMGGNCADCGGPWVALIGGKAHAYVHGGPNATLPGTPTPYIYHLVDATGVGNAWVADAAPAVTARTSNEGVGSSIGQIADAYALDMGSLNQSLLFFTEYTNGCSGAVTCAFPSYIEVAAINQPLASVVQETQTDGPSSQSIPAIQINGVPLNTVSNLNFIGASQVDYGQVTIGTAVLGTSGTPTTTTDTFIRSPGALGANWTGSANLTIISSGLVGDAVAGATSDADWYTGISWSSQQCSTVTLGALPPANYWFGPTVRETSTAGYALLVFHNTDKAYVYKYSAGSIAGTILTGPASLNSAMLVGDSYELCVNGSVLKAYQNGVNIAALNATDTDFPTGGSPGMVMPAGNVSTRISNFVGTDLSGSSASVVLGGSSISLGCTNQSPYTLTGAKTGMACTISGAYGNPTNVWADCAVTAADTITPRLCTTAATITPVSQQYNLRVIE